MLFRSDKIQVASRQAIRAAVFGREHQGWPLFDTHFDNMILDPGLFFFCQFGAAVLSFRWFFLEKLL